MKFEVTNNKVKWESALSQIDSFPGKVYYSYKYLELCQSSQDGDAFVAIGTTDGKIIIFYPFILRKVSKVIICKDTFSIETPYGYGGPAYFGDDIGCIKNFYLLFAKWCCEKNIIAEFVRFNPLTDNHKCFESIYSIEFNRKTVAIKLSNDMKFILEQGTSARKRNYRKALSAHLNFKITNNIESFKKLYQATMDRLHADKFYNFSQKYFQIIESTLGDSAIIAEVINSNGCVIASAIFLIDDQAVHYHLGGSSIEFHSLNPNVFLMLSMAEYAGKKNFTELHIGGGLNMSESDSLYRFKKGFSTNEHHFNIGKKIHNQTTYDYVSSNWAKITGCKPQILLHYHEIETAT